MKPVASKVLVNGVSKTIDSYVINEKYYFKLRDLVYVLNSTEKEMGWDSINEPISLKSGSVYTAVGGELAAGDGTAKLAVQDISELYKDGVGVQYFVYEINGDNYIKLCDIGKD